MVEPTEITKRWLEGVRAFEAGLPRVSNPYSSSETAINEGVAWYSGWDDAAVILRSKAELTNV